MPLITHKAEANYTIAIWEVTESIDTLKEILHSPSLLQHIGVDNLSAKQQRERITSHILIQHLLHAPLKIEKRANGAPYVSLSKTEISISHTKDYVVVAVSPQPIGIDIEEGGIRQQRVISRILNSNETYFNTLNEGNERTNYASLLWSAKEAIYKLIPTQNASIIDDITIPQQPISKQGEAKATVNINNTQHKVMLNYTFNSKNIVVVAQIEG